MSKLPNYTGTIKLISGLTQANGQDFPILEAHSIVVDEDDTRLDTIVEQVSNKMDKFGKLTVSKVPGLINYDPNHKFVDVSSGTEYPYFIGYQNNNGESALSFDVFGGAFIYSYSPSTKNESRFSINSKFAMLLSTNHESNVSYYTPFFGIDTVDHDNDLADDFIDLFGSLDYQAANVKYVNSEISKAMSMMSSGLKRIIVDELPTSNVDESAIYMLVTATDSLIGSEANLINYEGSPIYNATYYPNGDTFIYDENSIKVDCYSFIESNTGTEIKIAKPSALSDDNVVVNYAILSSIDTDNSPTTVSLDFYGYRKIDIIYLEYMYINSRWEIIGNTSTEGGSGNTAIITSMQNTINQLNDRLTALESKAATVYSV